MSGHFEWWCSIRERNHCYDDDNFFFFHFCLFHQCINRIGVNIFSMFARVGVFTRKSNFSLNDEAVEWEVLTPLLLDIGLMFLCHCTTHISITSCDKSQQMVPHCYTSVIVFSIWYLTFKGLCPVIYKHQYKMMPIYICTAWAGNTRNSKVIWHKTVTLLCFLLCKANGRKAEICQWKFRTIQRGAKFWAK